MPHNMPATTKSSKKIKRTAANSKPPPLKYELLDSHTICNPLGDQLYERRVVNNQEVIYTYSNRFKFWSPYSRTFIEDRWKKILSM